MADEARLRIWITRAQPGAAATAERVATLGHDPVVEPLINLRPIPDARIDLDGVAALAFTSANGVRAFADLSSERSLRVFAVGAATAQAAKVAGFRSVFSSDGDVAALAEGLAARKRELDGVVLHPGATELAGDLVGILAGQGVEARTVALYDSVPVSPPDGRIAELVGLDVALLHSPSAARVLARFLKDHPAPKMRAVALSKAVLKPLARVRMAAKQSPPFPLEAALLNLIGRGR
ncbi:uroporphyrinogen-III synthase [Phenylobacterium sp.]|uniref:uroporphyrinogen-III synthase n=1 Tax=Phenylobacterium sp. TaxID=1871053 RepID=UPI002732D9E3|nr:uroporphyrinogen-III synthase [Phenylobacterium sp.]MDP3660669.1 uroporphyrinogen-III synthase [Phenylobacterium sp.]